jgi:4-amino-4-deoxy-L-arabinose transferase-like glycosyltransferase
MEDNSLTAQSKQNKWITYGLPAAVALAVLLVVFLYFPFREKLQYDTDEGLNLMRAMLVNLGHPLYVEVSSDQPPLLTHLLALLFRVTGFNVNSARLLILMFSALLVWSGAQFLQFTWGSAATLALPVIMLLVPRYLELNVSVMIGVPSLALAMLALLLLAMWHQRQQEVWLVLSGLALSLSIMIKLFTGFLAPIFVIGLTAAAYNQRSTSGLSWRLLRPAVIWSAAFGIASLVIGVLLIGPQNVAPLVLTHLIATGVEAYQVTDFSINRHLADAVPLLLLASVGFLFTVQSRRWLTLYPLAWAVSAYVLLLFHAPVWYHHQLLVTVPAAVVAAAAAGASITWLLRLPRTRQWASLGTVLAVIGVVSLTYTLTSLLPPARKQLSDRPQFTGFVLTATAPKLEVLNLMNAYAPQTEWVVTDLPMYAFRIQRPVPPNLATFSRKRLETGELSESEIMDTMETYQPEMVLMGRFEIPPLEAYLRKNYRRVHAEEGLRLFVRRDLQ